MLKKNRLGLGIFLALAAFLACQLFTPVSHAQEKSITAKEATGHIGEVHTVCGMVASSKFASQSKKLTCPPKTDPHVKLEWWIAGRREDEQEAVYSGTDHWEAAG